MADYPQVRRVSLYMLVVFADSGNSRVFSFRNSDDCLNAFLEFRLDSSCFPYTFVKDIFVTPGHPLFKFGEDVYLPTSELRIKH